MPFAPTSTGYNGGLVRDAIQQKLDHIDQNINDPIWVRDNNLCSENQKADGKQKFLWNFPGQLNSTEITTIQDGWTTLGWTHALAENLPQSVNDGPGNLVWRLTISNLT